ncbi:ABC transporter permease [Cupriavidus pauculus]|uniref:Pyoverdine export ATP-binding/permease protein PvdT n=1 Tax=Cupriavidus pauculus TaxID=82633 RepID=A0A2N5C6Q4_9BURK|nr:ABC transporter permease [Cupriavidus pauculus]PLP97904.1 macrolide ABC transporter permease/ATP-binding protein MacB [Cupriavidus pauculus]
MHVPLLQLTNVTRRFSGADRDIVVLESISLTVDAGEFVAIVGPSGSGKSTLMHILGCLDHPSSGEYRVDGRAMRGLHDDELAYLRRRRFGFIFQRYQLLTYLDACDNVGMPATYAGADTGARGARALALLGRLGLADRARHRPNQLSGGQQQRVGIARALMNGADIILADEPTGALDCASGQQVMGILRDLNAEGRTVIVITHDAAVAAHAGRVIELRDGKIVADTRRPAAGQAGVSGAHAGCPSSHSVSPPRPGAGSVRSDGPRGRPGSLIDTARMAWQSIVSRRLRTMLATSGIAIGIASAVSIAWIGEAGKREALAAFGSIGTNVIYVLPGKDWGDSLGKEIRTLLPEDAAALAQEPFVDHATPVTSASVSMRHRAVDAAGQAQGVNAGYAAMYRVQLTEGTWFGAAAEQRRAPVAVIDEMTRRKLFATESSAVGRIILVDNVPCVVVGVAAVNPGMNISRRQLNVWLPHTTFADRLVGRSHVEEIAVRGNDRFPAAQVEQGVEKRLTQRHRSKDFFTINIDEMARTSQAMDARITRMLLTVSAIALIVGGIGVMNIMLVSVAERTPEIGIRMAVGARQRDIRMQFLCEAVMVCLMGAVLGIGLAFLTGWILPWLDGQTKMVFIFGPVVVATLCAMVVGIAFGFLPARNAARLNPVEALARE